VAQRPARNKPRSLRPNRTRGSSSRGCAIHVSASRELEVAGSRRRD
jgi:hypothetical protein